jgi:hypothetical protein
LEVLTCWVTFRVSASTKAEPSTDTVHKISSVLVLHQLYRLITTNLNLWFLM